MPLYSEVPHMTSPIYRQTPQEGSLSKGTSAENIHRDSQYKSHSSRIYEEFSEFHPENNGISCMEPPPAPPGRQRKIPALSDQNALPETCGSGYC